MDIDRAIVDGFNIKLAWTPISTAFSGRILQEHHAMLTQLRSCFADEHDAPNRLTNGKLRGLLEVSEERRNALITFVQNHRAIYGPDFDADKIEMYLDLADEIQRHVEAAVVAEANGGHFTVQQKAERAARREYEGRTQLVLPQEHHHMYLHGGSPLKHYFGDDEPPIRPMTRKRQEKLALIQEEEEKSPSPGKRVKLDSREPMLTPRTGMVIGMYGGAIPNLRGGDSPRSPSADGKHTLTAATKKFMNRRKSEAQLAEEWAMREREDFYRRRMIAEKHDVERAALLYQELQRREQIMSDSYLALTAAASDLLLAARRASFVAARQAAKHETKNRHAQPDADAPPPLTSAATAAPPAPAALTRKLQPDGSRNVMIAFAVALLLVAVLLAARPLLADYAHTLYQFVEQQWRAVTPKAAASVGKK